MIVLLFGSERTGFSQNLIGNGHLADIVQEGAARNFRKLCNIDIQGFRDRQSKCGDALAMAFGLGILQIQRAAQCFERIVVGAFQLLQALRGFARFARPQAFQDSADNCDFRAEAGGVPGRGERSCRAGLSRMASGCSRRRRSEWHRAQWKDRAWR